MTPEEREEAWVPREPAQAPGPRLAERRRFVSRPGGITAACGCRFTRTGGHWWHVTPCRAHQLAPFPITDENIKEQLAA